MHSIQKHPHVIAFIQNYMCIDEMTGGILSVLKEVSQ